MDFETRAIHDGQEPDPATGAVIVPIFQTSTYVQEEAGQTKGYEYSRTGNPTRAALETCLASLESAAHGFAFASGMAATTTVFHLLSPGDRVVCVNDVYGGTYRVFTKVYEPKGYQFEFVSAEDASERPADFLDERTRMVWIETPTNPLMSIVDLRAVTEAAHATGAFVVVDNTFATPYLQRPLELGADVVVHSTTKYLGGHSDVVGGFAGTNDPSIAERLAFLQNSLGAIPGPLDSWLVLRGLKTLAIRMRQHSANAQRIAEHLEIHPAVERVRYPGLESHPQHEPRPLPDGRLRRDDLLRRRGLRPGRTRGRPLDIDLAAGRVARRRREPHRAPRSDDAREPLRVALLDPGEPHTPVGRDRIGRRPARRPRRCPRTGPGRSQLGLNRAAGPVVPASSLFRL